MTTSRAHDAQPPATRRAGTNKTPETVGSDETPRLSPLQARVVREIVALVRRENLLRGAHLSEARLADEIGTSRSPVNVALRHLASLGALSYDLNRGYFLASDAAALTNIAQDLAAESHEPLYMQIAEARIRHELPDDVTETDLMRIYSVSRNVVRRVLIRIQQEGWVEKAVGHGWSFLPMIDAADAYEESHVFRAAIEPTGLMCSGFIVDLDELEGLRRQQLFIAEGGFKTITAIELFEANCQFHETIARWSHNRFILNAVRRTNALRRLVEYSKAKDRGPRRAAAREHLDILDAIAAQDLVKAAYLMRAHLDSARRTNLHIE